MLAKKYHLPIQRFPARAKTFYRGEHITLKTNNNNLFHNRVGVLVTKKTAPSAVARNRLRRKFFNLFQGAVKKGGLDLLVLVKPIKLDGAAEEKLFKELNLVKQRLTAGFDPFDQPRASKLTKK